MKLFVQRPKIFCFNNGKPATVLKALVYDMVVSLKSNFWCDNFLMSLLVDMIVSPDEQGLVVPLFNLTPSEEVPGSIPAVAARSLQVGPVSV